jgi:hypothetical protein
VNELGKCAREGRPRVTGRPLSGREKTSISVEKRVDVPIAVGYRAHRNSAFWNRDTMRKGTTRDGITDTERRLAEAFDLHPTGLSGLRAERAGVPVDVRVGELFRGGLVVAILRRTSRLHYVVTNHGRDYALTLIAPHDEQPAAS